MQLTTAVEYVQDPGRRLSAEERVKLESLYVWPRPKRALCRIEKANDRWRLGRY